ncbi:uncharacterized protein LOC120381437 isoform X2 [Mauremys reevesii]|uniref:uncharacterized protein LOC120381437 isoform X2 n=1 Tax=Mauremys reevesii TaxID=260615 RepID=UPI00193FBB37|nr:uncharacterized protein LOC120381437 isoform X2 [Mauremys reevesii]
MVTGDLFFPQFRSDSASFRAEESRPHFAPDRPVFQETGKRNGCGAAGSGPLGGGDRPPISERGNAPWTGLGKLTRFSVLEPGPASRWLPWNMQVAGCLELGFPYQPVARRGR